MKKTLDAKLLQTFLKKASDQLHGEWLLMGGTLLPAVGLDIRSTVDIDLVALHQNDNSQTLSLMKIADSLGLPVETINQAAAFFLNKLEYSPKDLILLIQGKSAKIYRPSVTLYWKLKLERLSETDVIDCQHYYQYCKGQKDSIITKDLDRLLALATKKASSADKKIRINSLKKLI